VTDAAIAAPLHRRWIAPLVGLFFALIVPALLTGRTPANITVTLTVPAMLISEATVWILALLLLAIVLFWEKRPLESLGLRRPTWRAVGIGIALAAALYIAAGVAGAIIMLLGGPVATEGQEEMVIGMPFWLQMLVSISAGSAEEILFRGYALTRMTELTGSRWWGAIIPIVVFGGVHAPFWGISHAFVAGFLGLCLTLIFLWRRNLWTNMAAHAALDAMVFIVTDLAALYGQTDI
jgi:uncharacterized protein